MMLNYCVIDTIPGYVALAGRDGVLTDSTLPAKSRKDAIAALGVGVEDGYVEDESAFGSLPAMLRDYFRGKRVDFSEVKVDIDDFGAFHKAVMLEAMRIPYGEIATYGTLARAAGNPRACRAAGSAMARNRIPIIIPCHRVVSAGGLGGFSLGMEWKKELLRLEGLDI